MNPTIPCRIRPHEDVYTALSKMAVVYFRLTLLTLLRSRWRKESSAKGAAGSARRRSVQVWRRRAGLKGVRATRQEQGCETQR